jgi:hypothetical protein
MPHPYIRWRGFRSIRLASHWRTTDVGMLESSALGVERPYCKGYDASGVGRFPQNVEWMTSFLPESRNFTESGSPISNTAESFTLQLKASPSQGSYALYTGSRLTATAAGSGTYSPATVRTGCGLLLYLYQFSISLVLRRLFMLDCRCSYVVLAHYSQSTHTQVQH